MGRLKYIALMVCSWYIQQTFAQYSSTEVENTTYGYYTANKWKPLIKYGKAAAKHGADEYYFNIRMGIAYYNKSNYLKAEKYFKKALNNDASSELAKEYLYWCAIYNGDDRETDAVYKTLSNETQQRVKYKPKKILESIFMEGGIKISDKQKVAKNLGYVNFGLGHKFSPVFSIYHAYTYQQQKTSWGSFRQHQYYFAPVVKLKKQLNLTFAFHYSHYASSIQFTDAFDTHSAPPPNPGPVTVFNDTLFKHHVHKFGNYKENLLFAQIGLSKTIKGFTIAPHVAFLQDWQKPNYIDSHRDSVIIDSHIGPTITSSTINLDSAATPYNTKSFYYESLIGVGLYYNFGKLTLGADVTAIFNKSIKTAVVSPWLHATFSKKVGMSAMFTYKGNFPTALFDGSQLYNSFDKIKYKASITGEFYVAKKLNLYATYQFEGIKDNFSNLDYNLHTLLIGLKISL